MASRKTPSPASDVTPETPPAPAPDRRQDILNAALACASEAGVDAISIDMVRARCGASVGSIYHHFGSREGIVAALFFEIFQAQSRHIQAQLDQTASAESGVRALVTGYLDWVVAQPERARFLFQARSAVGSGPRAAELAEFARRRNQALLQWFEPHLGTGTMVKVPCELMPSLVMGPVQSYCRAWLSGSSGLPSPSTYRDALATAAWKSIQA
jgi:AcrR family transcriptional regulator